MTITGCLFRIGTILEHAFGVPSTDPAQQAVELLTTLHRKVDTFMTATKDSLDALSSRFDDATNKVATRLTNLGEEIARLREQIAAGSPVTQAQLDAIETRLGGEVSTLEGLGADPNNPIPNPPANL